MKTHSNLVSGKAITLASLVAICGLVLAPMTSYALEASKPTTQNSGFCSGLSARVGTLRTQVAGTADKANDAWTKQDQKASAKDQKIDADIVADRQKADTNRTAEFAKLEAKATTDAQKQAVQTFETSVRSAISSRRAAYDAARKTFRDGVKDTVASHRAAVRGQINQFKASTEAAISTAEASCASNPSNGQAIRTTFAASLKSARQAFQGARKDDAKVGPAVKQLAAARTAAFKAADQAFHASIDTARAALKQAFSGSKAAI